MHYRNSKKTNKTKLRKIMNLREISRNALSSLNCRLKMHRGLGSKYRVLIINKMLLKTNTCKSKLTEWTKPEKRRSVLRCTLSVVQCPPLSNQGMQQLWMLAQYQLPVRDHSRFHHKEAIKIHSNNWQTVNPHIWQTLTLALAGAHNKSERERKTTVTTTILVTTSILSMTKMIKILFSTRILCIPLIEKVTIYNHYNPNIFSSEHWHGW